MSDSFYGDVRFPEWALKFLPEFSQEDGTRLELEPNSKVYFYAEDECKNGEVSIVANLSAMGIPYDSSSAEYFEYKAETIYFRFRDNGMTEEHGVLEGSDRVPAQDIIDLVDNHLTAAEIGKWCRDYIAPFQPLTPPLEEITESDYRNWLNQKAQVFRDHVLAALDGKHVSIARLYTIHGIEDGESTLFSMPGTVWSKHLQPRVCFSDKQIDEGERLFPGVRFFMAGKGRVAAFISPVAISPTDIPDLTIAVTEYLETLCKGEDA
ncbi:hypothetical protein [Acidithiobacillus ferrooxidans]|uniref:hypothetical protein n=1 Tax=Acidithiobacillus ferrooxidans TaxID=920 RepID=UPI0002E3C941|nr:hypothetical protein [Acidithiobacillus ferrooxidans]